MQGRKELCTSGEKVTTDQATQRHFTVTLHTKGWDLAEVKGTKPQKQLRHVFLVLNRVQLVPSQLS